MLSGQDPRQALISGGLNLAGQGIQSGVNSLFSGTNTPSWLSGTIANTAAGLGKGYLGQQIYGQQQPRPTMMTQRPPPNMAAMKQQYMAMSPQQQAALRAQYGRG